jgi:steroid delta-isomerase-like uncharacterized protein
MSRGMSAEENKALAHRA